MKRLFFLILAIGIVFASLTFIAIPSMVSAQEEAVAPPAAEETQIININTALAEDLATLKGIGEKTAQAIVEYRTQNGPFKAIEDIKNVKGIGDKKFEEIKDSITIG